jgi:hypothetical protein
VPQGDPTGIREDAARRTKGAASLPGTYNEPLFVLYSSEGLPHQTHTFGGGGCIYVIDKAKDPLCIQFSERGMFVLSFNSATMLEAIFEILRVDDRLAPLPTDMSVSWSGQGHLPENVSRRTLQFPCALDRPNVEECRLVGCDAVWLF